MRRTLAILSIVALSFSWERSLAWSQSQSTAEPPAQAEETQAPSEKTAEQPPANKPKNIKEWVSANRTRKSAVVGAIAGAILGGLIARARGGNVAEGMAAGAVVGGVTGYLIGRHRDKIYYGRDQAVLLAHYEPSQGYVIQIQSVQFDPQTIKPGQSATLHIRYLVIGPNPHETIQIKCYRGIKYQESYLTGDQAVLKVPNGGGVVESTAEFTLPKEAPAGTYAAEAMLEDAQGRANGSETSPLYIES